jgi:hypothetical protein
VIKVEKKDRDAVKIMISEKGHIAAKSVAGCVKEIAAEKGDKSFTFHGSSTIRTSATPLKSR